MKKSILITVCALIAALCCFSFAACDLLAGEKDVSGNYKLESFTTKDGSTYNVGDSYDGETVSSEGVTLKLEEYESGFVNNDGKPVKFRKFTLLSEIGDGFHSMGFFTRSGNSLTFPSLASDSYNGDNMGIDSGEYKGKVIVNEITVVFPEGNTLKSAVLKKV